MNKKVLVLLEELSTAFKHVAFISYFITSILFTLMFSVLIVFAFALSPENMTVLTDKVFLFLDKAKWYLLSFMIGIGVYGILKLIFTNVKDKE